MKPAEPASLTIINKSQFALKEIRIHPDPNYLDAGNLLKEDLPTESSVTFQYAGQIFVTIIRQKNPLGDDLIAFTTTSPLSLKGNEKYTIKIFDDIFRINKGEENSSSDTLETKPN